MRQAIPGVLAVGLVVFAAAPMAQQGPLVVPIVGSPAAQQQPPATAPPTTQESTPAGVPVSTPASMPQAQSGQPSAAAARKLQLTFNKGAVTLVAQNVTVREILSEWQRQNGCQFVNADKLSGGMVSFEFNQESELRVIDSLLRGAAGYLVGPRADTEQSGSVCGAVYILPTSRPTSSVASYTPTASSPQAAPLMQPGSPDDEIPPVQQLMGPQQIQPRPGPSGQPPASAPPVQTSPFGPIPIGPSTAPGVGQIGGPPVTPAPASPMPNGPGRGRGR